MKSQWITWMTAGLATLLALLASWPGARAQDFELHDLGGHPLCGASAAVIVPCPDAGERCLPIPGTCAGL